MTFCTVLHTIHHGFEVPLHYFPRLWSQSFEVLETLGRSVGVVIIIGFSLAIFLTSSIVASSIEAQAANLEDSLGRTIVVTASDASFDSSATISEDILNLTNNMSQVESVQTFVTEVDRSGISAILAQGGPPNPEALRAAVRFISGQNLECRT